MLMKRLSNQIRIIGGRWRGRKISFPSLDELRPTPDRIRETLFNWLAPHIVNARCLDLFAGSGILGLEALSRGASNLVVVEQNRAAFNGIQITAGILQATDIELINANAISWLQGPPNPFNIIFLDPPYTKNFLPECFMLLEKGWLAPHALIYFESKTPITPNLLPESWILSKEKKTGNVYYYLAQNG